MALQGTLDVVSVADVLRLLAATAKTGQLRLESDVGRGVVWVRDGRVAAVTGAEPRHDLPVAELLFWFTHRADEGWFAFEVDDHAPDTDRSLDVEVLVAEMAAIASEWDELHRVVPSLAHRVALADHLPGPQITIDAKMWPGVLAAASGPTVQAIGARFRLGDLDALRTARDLVSTGLVEVRPPVGAPTGPDLAGNGHTSPPLPMAVT